MIITAAALTTAGVSTMAALKFLSIGAGISVTTAVSALGIKHAIDSKKSPAPPIDDKLKAQEEKTASSAKKILDSAKQETKAIDESFSHQAKKLLQKNDELASIVSSDEKATKAIDKACKSLDDSKDLIDEKIAATLAKFSHTIDLQNAKIEELMQENKQLIELLNQRNKQIDLLISHISQGHRIDTQSNTLPETSSPTPS